MFSWLHRALGIPEIPLLNDDDPDHRFYDDPPGKDSPQPDWESIFLTLREERRDNIRNNAFQVTPDDFLTVDTFDAVGMDSVDNPQPAKNLFSVNQQRLPDNLFYWFVSQSFIGYQACALVAQQWLVNRACTLKGRDAVRNGFNIEFNEGVEVPPDIHSKIEALNKRFHLKRMLTRADKFKNVFGISHILFRVDSADPDYYEKPFNPDGITAGSYRGMIHIDPYWITPLLTTEAVENPESAGFYEPNYWVISGRKYHRSHFVILKGPEVSDILKPSYLYGGLPLTQLILERVYGAERTANEAPLLALSKRLVIRYMEDLEAVAANPESFAEFIHMMTECRDNFGLYVDSNENRIEQQDTSLADFDSVVMTQYQIVAGISGIPATKLMGTSPKGFQSTGEHELKTYHEELESIQENDLEPIVNKHHLYLMRSHIAHQMPDKQPVEVSIVWRPLEVMSDKERAEVNELKSRTAINYQNTGAIDPYNIRDSLIADEDSGYSGIEAIERPDEPDELEIPDEPAESEGSGGFDDEHQQEEDEQTSRDVIRKERRKWFIYSQSGEKLDGPFSRKYMAIKRLQEIEAAQNAKED